MLFLNPFPVPRRTLSWSSGKSGVPKAAACTTSLSVMALLVLGALLCSVCTALSPREATVLGDTFEAGADVFFESPPPSLAAFGSSEVSFSFSLPSLVFSFSFFSSSFFSYRLCAFRGCPTLEPSLVAAGSVVFSAGSPA